MRLSSPEEAVALGAGRRMAFTNGVFDILHAGHVMYLERARSEGDLLVVGLNSDASVRRLGKGANRPINTLEDRAMVIGALRCVDAVVAFDEDTPEAIIELLKPAVHVKGGDYRPEDLPEKRVVDSYGGKIVIVPLLEGRSTTNTLRKLGAE